MMNRKLSKENDETPSIGVSSQVADSSVPLPKQSFKRFLTSRHICQLLTLFMLAAFFQRELSIDLNIYDTYGIGQDGFDTGIFAQGTWLLSHGMNPYVTIRELNLFGDHASFILLLVAPLYRLWPDPRLLITLQVFAISIAGYAIYRLALRRITPFASLAIVFCFFILRAVTGAAEWQFHPESLALPALVFAVLAYENKCNRTFVALLFIALLCKEDVSLVVAGIGAVVFFKGNRRLGAGVVIGAIAYFTIALTVIGLFNPNGSPYLSKEYGINDDRPIAIITSLPHIFGHFFITVASTDGAKYLTLMLVPFLLFSLVGSWWLVPAAIPMFLNLASQNKGLISLGFHYSLIAAAFVAIAAADGLRRISTHRKVLRITAVAMCISSIALAGPLLHDDATVHPGSHYSPSVFDDALKLIPKDASVSASYNIQVHLSSREKIYDFPSPFGIRPMVLDDKPENANIINSVQYVIIDLEFLGPEGTARNLRIARSANSR